MHILYIGDTEGLSGYAQSARRLIFCLQDLLHTRISVRYVPHDSNKSLNSRELNRVRSLYGTGGQIAFHHQFPSMFKPIDGVYNIGVTMYENDRLPTSWVKQCNAMSEIWVPSIHNKTIFRKSGVSAPIEIVPFPIDINEYVPSTKKDDRFVFLSVFQWTERKNWRDLITAFVEEFGSNDNVVLKLKVYRSSHSATEQAAIKKEIQKIAGRSKANIDLLLQPEDEMTSLYQNSDVFVLPSRGEAIGLPLLEAMACGKPCITTAWGGPTDFIDESNGYLLPFTLNPIFNMSHIPEYEEGQMWAAISKTDLRAKLRTAYQDQNGVLHKGIEARKTIEQRYSTDVISLILQKHLRRISNSTVRGTSPGVPPIVYRGDAYGLSGYSNAIRNNIDAIRLAGIPLRLESIFHDRKQIKDKTIQDRLKTLTNAVVSTKILIDHQTPEFFSTSSNHYRIGATYFETDKIPAAWVPKCNAMNEIWLPCEANKISFKNSGVTSVLTIMPPFVDTEHFSPHKKALKINNRKRFTFLSVFEFIPRKGWDVLVEAFARAFDPDEDVCLIIKTYRTFPSMNETEIRAQIKSHLAQKGISKHPLILIFTNPLPHEAMPHLYASADVFVLPTRGESICYPALEAMACGKPCIVTGGGGQSEFVNDERGFLISHSIGNAESFTHSPWYDKTQQTTEPSVSDLTNLMRTAFENEELLKHKSVLSRQYIEQTCSFEAGSKAVISRLEEISRINNLY